MKNNRYESPVIFIGPSFSRISYQVKKLFCENVDCIQPTSTKTLASGKDALLLTFISVSEKCMLISGYPRSSSEADLLHIQLLAGRKNNERILIFNLHDGEKDNAAARFFKTDGKANKIYRVVDVDNRKPIDQTITKIKSNIFMFSVVN